MAKKAVTISEKVKELERLYDDIPENKKVLAGKLISRIAFLEYAAEALEKTMEAAGKGAFSNEYKNGNNQSGRNVSPEMKSYLSTVQRMESAINSLDRMIVREAPPEAETDITDFIEGKK